ncbi:MAG: conserved rane protein of unknown function, Transglutaminase-like [Phycisphaerales bacterium]|nr:conserved rane protein of unknown function, Transglutaminase-like [Phycisphaerales bacterium]
MYDIRQFRPLLYALLMIGFTGYAVAAESPGLWLLAVAATSLNAYLVKKKLFKPLPRFVANMITLLFAGWLLLRVRSNGVGPTIFAIGEFLIFLQLVKLYEQRGNRDIAQLLVLSLLLMIAAAISTASLFFGVIFIGYLFLSLYCCLLFHLKAESDYARQVTGLDESKINPMTLRQDQRFLSRSMRRLTGIVSTFAIGTAILVFLLFPRGSGAGLIGNMSFQPSQAMTGFSDQIADQNIARIQQNEAQAGWVTIKKNGETWGGPGEVIYLRGNVADTYVSDPNDMADRWTWKRTATEPRELLTKPLETGADQYEQQIRLLPLGVKTLFALPGVVSFNSGGDLKATRGTDDDVLSTYEDGTNERSYTVVSTNAEIIPAADPRALSLPQATLFPIPPEIKEFAVRDDVAGTDGRGNLAQQRLARRSVSELDETIARNFEVYLRSNFKYSLDLSDVRQRDDRSPLVSFITEVKKGHCERFAGAMVLMCQSVGMKARMVSGFKCDEFNTLGGYYVVRQSHAHAWVEVLTNAGWERFDPTSSTEANAASRSLTLWQRMRAAMNFLEYKWGNAVVNYDAESRSNIIQNTESQLSSTAVNTAGWMQDLRDRISATINDYLKIENFFSVLTTMIAGVILVLVLVVIVIVALRLRLYRRARRIGLNTLSNNDQRRLAKQLAFYDQMLQALERRDITRPPHLTPREFGASVGFLPAEVFDIVQRLTRIFYRIRYGEAELQPAQQKRLVRSVERIEAVLGPTI